MPSQLEEASHAPNFQQALQSLLKEEMNRLSVVLKLKQTNPESLSIQHFHK